MNKTNFEPLEIRIELMTPIINPIRKQAHPIHLDALLIAVLAARQKATPVRINRPETNLFTPERAIEARVPLAVVGDKRPIYQASVAFIDGESEIGDYTFTKRSPSHEVASRINLKQWLETCPTIRTNILFECVGDKEAISDILKDVRGVGTMRRVGFGEVIGFTVESSDKPKNECGLFRYHDRIIPARELPIIDWEDKANWDARAVVSRPPYWLREETEICWIPPTDLVAVA